MLRKNMMGRYDSSNKSKIKEDHSNEKIVVRRSSSKASETRVPRESRYLSLAIVKDAEGSLRRDTSMVRRGNIHNEGLESIQYRVKQNEAYQRIQDSRKQNNPIFITGLWGKKLYQKIYYQTDLYNLNMKRPKKKRKLQSDAQTSKDSFQSSRKLIELGIDVSNIERKIKSEKELEGECGTQELAGRRGRDTDSREEAGTSSSRHLMRRTRRSFACSQVTRISRDASNDSATNRYSSKRISINQMTRRGLFPQTKSQSPLRNGLRVEEGPKTTIERQREDLFHKVLERDVGDSGGLNTRRELPRAGESFLSFQLRKQGADLKQGGFDIEIAHRMAQQNGKPLKDKKLMVELLQIYFDRQVLHKTNPKLAY